MSLTYKPSPTFQYSKENPNEHWEGRRYPEYMLVKMGEADNTPGDPFDVDMESNDVKELE